MNIIFQDVLQTSNAPKKLISSALSDTFNNPAELEISLSEPSTINGIGIGYTNSTIIGIELEDTNNNIFNTFITFENNGLYLFNTTYENIISIKLIFDGYYVGRIGLGKVINLPTSIPKEPTLVSTNKPRVTLSGQVINGLGGYNYWRLSVDTRYKIDANKLNEIIKGYDSLSSGLPLFVSFEDEKDRLPINRLYCNDTNQQQFSFESSINKCLFSRRFIFEERF